MMVIFYLLARFFTWLPAALHPSVHPAASQILTVLPTVKQSPPSRKRLSRG